MSSQRTDVHRIGELVPDHYRYICVLDLYAGDDRDDVAPLTSLTELPGQWASFQVNQRMKRRKFQAQAIGDRPKLSQCNICGAHIRYAVVWSYKPADRPLGIITTGVDCAASMGSAQISEIHAEAGALKEFVSGMRKAVRDAEVKAENRAKAAAEADKTGKWRKRQLRSEQWLAEDTKRKHIIGFLSATAQEHNAEKVCECFLCDVYAGYEEWGSLTPKQEAAVFKRMTQEQAKPVGPVVAPTGEDLRVTGKVTSVKPRPLIHDASGTALGIRSDEGFRVWGVFTDETAPLKEIGVGTKISLVCNLTEAKDSPDLAWINKPRDVKVLDKSESWA